MNHYRVVENRKDQKTMHRVWVQAKFRKPVEGEKTKEEEEVESPHGKAEKKARLE